MSRLLYWFKLVVFSKKLRSAWIIFGLSWAVISLLAVSVRAEDDNLLMVSIATPAKHGSAKVVNAKVLIQAPPALVWDLITNYSQFSEILPGYEKSRVVQSSGSSKLVDIAMKVAAFLPTYRYQIQAQENEKAYQLNFTRVSGDFKSLHAAYRLTPQSNGKATLLIYRLSIDPGSTLPGAQALIKANTERSLKAIERHSERQFRKSEIGQR